MLELRLKAENHEIQVACGGLESHTFPFAQIGLTEADVTAFFEDPSTYGLRLYQAVFPPNTAACTALAGLVTGERLVLRMDDEALASTPWEYLFDGKRWLAEHYALLRAGLRDSAQPNGQPGAERTRLLFVPANPLMFRNTPARFSLGVDKEWEDLHGALADFGPACDLVKIVPPSLDAMHAAMAGSTQAVIHFSGHGGRDADGNALLYFEEPSGAAELVSGRDFCLRAHGAGLVVLSACVSAAPGESEEANLAGMLAAQGAPFVLGMQISVADERARAFTTRFYRFLFGGCDIPEAVRQARMALSGDRLAMGTPVLYAADPAAEGRLAGGEQGLRVFDRAARGDLSELAVTERGFFGRQRELVQVGALLTAEREKQNETYVPRAITLQGAGGIGKTALLRRAAERFAWAFPDGVLGIALEPLPNTPAALLERIERFFGLADGSRLEVDARGRAAAEQMKGRRALLALDNFETLAYAREGDDAEKKKTAAAIYRFLRLLPAGGITLLASSRELTHLPGEKANVVLVSGLEDAAGARLFSSGVQQRGDALDEVLLRELNRRVGGHALALRLLGPIFDDDAAPNLKAFLEKLEEILPTAAEAWDDGLRHDTLQACFSFSLDALKGKDAPLRDAIARLSLFRGSFQDWMAEPVLYGWTTDAEQTKTRREQAGRALRELVEHGLLEEEVQVIDAETAWRFYRLHPALRPFALARLAGAAREGAEEGYWNAMAWLARRAYPHEEDQRWVGVQSDPGLVEVVRKALPDLLHAAGQREDARGASLRYWIASCLVQLGEPEEGMRLYCQSLEIQDRLDDQRGKSITLHMMAYVYDRRGELEEAMRLYQESLDIKERLDDQQGRATTLLEMAHIYAIRGELEEAMRLYQQSLDIYKGLNYQRGKSAALHAMANIYAKRGELDEAMRLYRQLLEIDEQRGDQQGKATALHDMANIYVRRGELDEAMRLYRQSLEIYAGLSFGDGIAATLHAMANIYAMRGELDKAMRLCQQSMDIKQRLGDQPGRALTLLMMGRLLWLTGQHEAGLARLVDALSVLVRLKIEPASQQMIAEILASCRRDIGPARFDPLWKNITGGEVPEWLAGAGGEGQGMSVEQWVRASVRAARGKTAEGKALFELAQQVGKDMDMPDAVRRLAEVLQQILIGNFSPDLSGLPEELAALVRTALVE